MSSNKPAPSASMLNDIFPDVAYSLERTAVTDQLRALGIEFTVKRKRYELIIELPTTADGILRITATEGGSGQHARFFHTSAPKQLRLPGGKVVKSDAREVVHATVEFISHGEHPDVTYLLKEPNFAEVIDTAIESLSQIDGIYLSVIKRQRPQRRNHPQQPELGQE